MNAERNVTASFAAVQNPVLTAQINGPADARADSQPAGVACTGPTPGSGDCSETYAPGTVVSLFATGAPFGSWTGCDQVIDDRICRLTMNASRSVTASFQP